MNGPPAVFRAACAAVWLLTLFVPGFARAAEAPQTTNSIAVATNATPIARPGTPLPLEEFQRRYAEDARTNKVTLTVPLYTNAPYAEVRLRAAALAGDGYSAWVCKGTNDTERVLWKRLAATNGWVLAQVELAQELERPGEYSCDLLVTNSVMLSNSFPSAGLEEGANYEVHSEAMSIKEFQRAMARNYTGVEFHSWREIRAAPTPAQLAEARHWRARAKASLPKLQAAAATNEPRSLYALGWLHNEGQLVATNRDLGRRLTRQAADAGVVPALAKLGMAIEDDSDPFESLQWLRQAATNGLVSAQTKIASEYVVAEILHDAWGIAGSTDRGLLLTNRFGIALNFSNLADKYAPPEIDKALRAVIRAHCDAEAARWSFETAHQGSAFAQGWLGTAYAGGRGVAEDPGMAVTWYHAAAAQNQASAVLSLANCYQQGIGVPKSSTLAVEWLRKAADLDSDNAMFAMYELALCYFGGEGVSQSDAEGMKWLERATAQGFPDSPDYDAKKAHWAFADGDYQDALKYARKTAAQGVALGMSVLARAYEEGKGVASDLGVALDWCKKAANLGEMQEQFRLGLRFEEGKGVSRDYTEAVKWYGRAARQGADAAQNNLGLLYERGHGVPRDYVEAYKWFSLSAANGDSDISRRNLDRVTQIMTAGQIAEAQRLAREFVPRPEAGGSSTDGAKPIATGTGFFLTDDGYLVTNHHVTETAGSLRVRTATGDLPAKLIRSDAANDLALLKVEGRFTALPVKPSRGVRLGETVATVGFPNPGLQGFSPKLTKGEISSLAGSQDDPKHFQISLPVQPGNSGGALVDARGNVVGVVVAKLSQRAALATTGTLAENVNYAVKSSFLLSFLESVPGLAERLPEPRTAPRPFEEVVSEAEKATVLVLVY